MVMVASSPSLEVVGWGGNCDSLRAPTPPPNRCARWPPAIRSGAEVLANRPQLPHHIREGGGHGPVGTLMSGPRKATSDDWRDEVCQTCASLPYFFLLGEGGGAGRRKEKGSERDHLPDWGVDSPSRAHEALSLSLANQPLIRKAEAAAERKKTAETAPISFQPQHQSSALATSRR